MILTIEATDQITEFDNVPCRVWKGTHANGSTCLVFVHRVAVPVRVDQTVFEQNLLEQLPPGRHVPLSSVLR